MTINLEYGDVLIFSSISLHRSIPTNNVSLSLPLLVRNTRYDNASYERLKNLKIFLILIYQKLKELWVIIFFHIQDLNLIDRNNSFV